LLVMRQPVVATQEASTRTQTADSRAFIASVLSNSESFSPGVNDAG